MRINISIGVLRHAACIPDYSGWPATDSHRVPGCQRLIIKFYAAIVGNRQNEIKLYLNLAGKHTFRVYPIDSQSKFSTEWNPCCGFRRRYRYTNQEFVLSECDCPHDLGYSQRHMIKNTGAKSGFFVR